MRFKLFILSTVFFVVNGFYEFSNRSLPLNCGKRNYEEVETKISKMARVGEFPWMVRIGMHKYDTLERFFFCTGTLIHRRYVVTAAHCGKSSSFVRLGSNNEDQQCSPSTQDIPIEGHIFAQHCLLSKVNDIVILILQNEARFNDFVRPICLPNKVLSHKELKTGDLVAAGWGVIYQGYATLYGNVTKTDESLKYINVHLLERQKCDGILGRNLTDTELCIGYPPGVRNPRLIDSGGPLIRTMFETPHIGTRSYLIGIASHNMGKCQKGVCAVVYTSVSDFVKWLIEEINSQVIRTLVEEEE